MSPRWWSQPFAPEGSAAAEGIAKQLGRPALDPLTVLVRESAQNSWDARRSDVPLTYNVSIRSLGADALAWQERILPAPPVDAGVDLEGAVEDDSPIVVISDRGTVGLGGPLRAGQRAAPDERPDFVQFLRNVGEPSDHALGGGTYGFGKGILYRLSSASTILVDTFTLDAQGPRRRLMGATLGHSWYLGDQRFTGRHWWGTVGEDGVPDPVLGDEAAALASQLGLPGFDDGRTGTDIVILGADLGLTGDEGELRPRTRQEAATFIVSSILWHLWPKAVPGGDHVTIEFSVDVDGNSLEVPAPSKVADLRPFVDALSAIRRGEGVPCTRASPPRAVGAFAFAAAGAAASRRDRQIVTAARPFEGPTHHIVRMRDAELVVDYLPATPHPDALLRYGAVFKASPEADEHFAAAEPPTHDDWIDKGLSGTTRGVVQGARRFVLKEVDARLGGGTALGAGTGGLGGLAARLSALLPLTSAGTHLDADAEDGAQWGRGDTIHEGGGATDISTGDSTRPARPRLSRVLRLVEPPRLYMDGAHPFLAARLAIPASAVPRTIWVDVLVVTQSGGVESEPPAGETVHSVDQWEPVGGGARHRGETLLLPPGDASEWWIMAQHTPDAVVRFRPRQVEHHES